MSDHTLDNFLKELEGYLTHITFDERYDVLKEVKEDLNAQLSTTGDSRLVVSKYRDQKKFIDHYLLKRNLPPAKKKRSLFKIVSMMVLGFFLVMGIALTLMVKSILPIFEINEEKGTLTLFGKPLVVENSETRITRQMTTAGNTTLEGNISGSKFEKLNIRGNEIDLTLKAEGDQFVYKCQGNSEATDLVTEKGQVLQLYLAGRNKCLITVPSNKPFDLDFRAGSVVLNQLSQDFTVALDAGTVTWFYPGSPTYKLNASASKVVGMKGAMDQGEYSSDINVNQGTIVIQ